jgi:glycerate kinase
MRIVVAPNSFRDGSPAQVVASAMARGARRVLADADVVPLPLADGGDGTLAVLAGILDAEIREIVVRDPRGAPVEAHLALGRDGTAVVEMAEASGLRTLQAERRDPFRCSTYGTGELLRAALDAGAERILLGAGGSGTIDGGAGALAALGAVFLDAHGRRLEPTPEGLAPLAAADFGSLDPRLSGARLHVLGDVRTSLRTCVDVFGPQKGLRPETADAVKDALRKLFELSGGSAEDVFDRPWWGAGGGIAGGLATFAGARVEGGADFIARLAGLPARLETADLLLTGEGRFDRTTLEGKLTAVIAGMAAERDVPTVVIAGHVLLEAEALPPGVVACFSSAPGPGSLEEALAAAPSRIERTTEEVLRLYDSGRRKGKAVSTHAPGEDQRLG